MTKKLKVAEQNEKVIPPSRPPETEWDENWYQQEHDFNELCQQHESQIEMHEEL